MREIEVDCYAGYRDEETPRRLRVGWRVVEVLEVLDRWREPDHRFFRLRGDDGRTYLVRHREPSRRWELIAETD